MDDYTQDDFVAPEQPPAPRRDRDLAAVALMGVGVCGVVGTLFAISPIVGALALFAGMIGVGALLGMSTSKTP